MRARENRCTGHNDESRVRTNSPVPPIPSPGLSSREVIVHFGWTTFRLESRHQLTIQPRADVSPCAIRQSHGLIAATSQDYERFPPRICFPPPPPPPPVPLRTLVASVRCKSTPVSLFPLFPSFSSLYTCHRNWKEYPANSVHFLVYLSTRPVYIGEREERIRSSTCHVRLRRTIKRVACFLSFSSSEKKRPDYVFCRQLARSGIDFLPSLSALIRFVYELIMTG